MPWHGTRESAKMKLVVSMRVLGSILVVVGYFVLTHVNTTTGVWLHFISDSISLPFFIKTRAWDVVVMLMFLSTISISKLIGL